MNENVLEILLQRQANGYIIGQDDDGHKLALWTMGGGNINVFTAGQMRALCDLGLLQYFDGLGGNSGGVPITTAALNEQINTMAPDFYKETFTNSKNARFHTSMSPVGLVVAINEDKLFGNDTNHGILRHGKFALNFYTARSALELGGQELLVALTRADTGDGELVSVKRDLEGELIDPAYLRQLTFASALASEKAEPIVINGRPYMDGGWSDVALPLHQLESQGYTNILVLDTRRDAELSDSYVPRASANLLGKNQSKGIAEARRQAGLQTNQARREIEASNGQHMRIQPTIAFGKHSDPQSYDDAYKNGYDEVIGLVNKLKNEHSTTL